MKRLLDCNASDFCRMNGKELKHTIRQIALMSKMADADLYHIGDAGYHGIAIPENIMTYSIAIRGKRHTYIRMARSPLR
jgi:hypothetical protein